MVNYGKEYHPLWEKPRHHSDPSVKTNQVHWMDLFYDLIHVVSIFLLGNYISHHLDFSGFLVFFSLFTVFWTSWGDYTFYNSLYLSTDYKHRILSAFQIVTIMVMTAAIPHIHEEGFMFFMGAYAVNRFLLALFYYRAGIHNKSKNNFSREVVKKFIIGGIAAIIIGFVSPPFGFIGLFLLIVIEQLFYISSKYGILRYGASTPRLHHLSERMGLFLIICLGEGFFKLVNTLSEQSIEFVSVQLFINYALCGVSLYLLAWMYYDFVGNGVLKNEKTKTMASWWYGHFTLMFSAVMIGVAVSANAKTEFFEAYPMKYALLGSLGLVIYIASLGLIQSNIKKRYSHNFITRKTRIFGMILALISLIPIYFKLPTIIGFIGFGLALISQLVIPIIRGYIVEHDVGINKKNILIKLNLLLGKFKK